MYDYPVFLNMKGRRAVVIGGGKVAERKVASLIKSGAEVCVISPHLTPRLTRWAGRKKIKTVRRRYRPGDMDQATLAFAATNDIAVNQTVTCTAKQAGIWINRADLGSEGDFILPAVLKKGRLAIAVSTGGKDPAMAKKTRDNLMAFLTSEPSIKKRTAKKKGQKGKT